MTTDDTGAALNRKLAERLGYKPRRNIAGGIDITSADGSWYWGNCTTEDEAWWDALAELPDWANDAGAALALCLEISEAHNYELVIAQYRGGVVVSFQCGKTDAYVMHTHGETPALALARLALAALT